MKKVSTLLMLFFTMIGATWAQQFIVNGIKQIPSQVTEPTQVTNGYYLLKQVNDHNNCAGGEGVGFIKFQNEVVGTTATSKGTDQEPTTVNYVWYVEVKNGNIIISTANKKASWQLPNKATQVKPLVAYGEGSELVRVTTKPDPLKGETTSAPKEHSCFLRNTAGDSYIHFCGDNLGSWTSAGNNSTFMVQFYKLNENTDLNKTDLNDKDRAILKLQETLALAETYKDSYDKTWRIGKGVNKYSQQQGDADFVTTYNEAKRIADNPQGSETAQQVTDKDTQLKTLISNLSINQPENGKFYRLRCVDKNQYILKTLKESCLETKNEQQNAVLLYCQDVENQKTLLAFNNGQYFGNAGGNNNFAYIAVGNITNNKFTFSEGGQKGCYKVQQGNRYIYGARDKMDSDTNPNSNGYYWWLEEVTTLPVTVTEAGWATLYAPVALTIPAEVKVYTGKVNVNKLTLTQVKTTIPANTPVLIEANANTYNFNINYEATATSTIDQSLTGSIETKAKPTEATTTIFTLQKHATAGLGFFKYKGDNLQGFRAYGENLLGTSTAAAGLVFDFGSVTGIEGATTDNGEKAEIYDLSGRRVAKAQKGIYIINGKKVIIK